MSKPHIVACIFARGGSKGLPRKNVLPLAGKPLIGYSVETALQSSWVDRVIVSTDCQEIAETAAAFGAEIPFMRPVELALDDSPERLAWQHAIETVEQQDGRRIDVLVSLPPTSPLRSVEDVDRCIKALLTTNADIVVTGKPAERSPYFNMVVLDEEGNASLAVKPAGEVMRRQDAPPMYDLTTVAYAARRDPIFEQDSIFSGIVKVVMIPPHRAVDIDTKMDFQFAEFLLCQPKFPGDPVRQSSTAGNPIPSDLSAN